MGRFKPFLLHSADHEGPLGCPVARLAQTWPKPSVLTKMAPFWVFWLHVKNAQKGMFFSDSARSPHRTAKPSRGCLPLAHPRALPAVVLSDRRSPSAMCEFPFEWWGCHAGIDQIAAAVFPAVCDLTPKARKTFFHESSESESALFGIPPAPGYLCGPYFKIIARTDHGNPAVPGRQSTRLGSRSTRCLFGLGKAHFS